MRDWGAVTRKQVGRLQVRVDAGRDPLTGCAPYLSQEVPGHTGTALREAKQIEARLLGGRCSAGSRCASSAPRPSMPSTRVRTGGGKGGRPLSFSVVRDGRARKEAPINV